LERADFLGPQPPGRVAQLQATASVVVVPSPDDNFPFTCIEAMAAGRVVVAANAGGAAEMIEHGTSGLLFEPHNCDALAEALSTALRMSDAEREAMGHAARERIAELCNASQIIEMRLAHAAAFTASPVAGTRPHSGVPIELRAISAGVPAPARPIWQRVAKRIFGR
ncbi:MAG: glycosyltransferase, partial [Planctomycetota bacterium]